MIRSRTRLRTRMAASSGAATSRALVTPAASSWRAAIGITTRSASGPYVSFQRAESPWPSRIRLTCMSQRPGSTVMPSVEMISAPSGMTTSPTPPTARMRSPSITTMPSGIGSLP